MNDKTPVDVKSLKIELERTENDVLVLKHTYYLSYEFEGASPELEHSTSYTTSQSPTVVDECSIVTLMSSIKRGMIQEYTSLSDKYRDRLYDLNYVDETITKPLNIMSKEQLAALWDGGRGCEILAVVAGNTVDFTTPPTTTIDCTGSGLLGYAVRDFVPQNDAEIDDRIRLREILHHLTFYKIPDDALKFMTPPWTWVQIS